MWMFDHWQILIAVGLTLIQPKASRFSCITPVVQWFSLYYENSLVRRYKRTFSNGVIFWFVVVGSVVLAAISIHVFLSFLPEYVAWFFDIFILSQCIAAKDFHNEIRSIHHLLKRGNLTAAQAKLFLIEPKDARSTNVSEISDLALKSLAESCENGFVASLFWALIGGMPGVIFYRTSSIIGSMVGHLNSRYEFFGKFSVDAHYFLNVIPDRLCAFISFLLNRKSGWSTISEQADAHPRHLSAWTFSSIAHALGLRFREEDDSEATGNSVFNSQGKPPEPADLQRGLKWWWQVVGVTCALAVFICVIREVIFRFWIK